jgi:hypothetical protein
MSKPKDIDLNQVQRYVAGSQQSDKTVYEQLRDVRAYLGADGQRMTNKAKSFLANEVHLLQRACSKMNERKKQKTGG